MKTEEEEAAAEQQRAAARRAAEYLEQSRDAQEDLTDAIYNMLNEPTHRGGALSVHDPREYAGKWKGPRLGETQRVLVDYQLSRMRGGHGVVEFTMLQSVLSQLPRGTSYTLADVGCATGYYSEVIRFLCPEVPIEYTGIDYNQDSIDLARAYYPGVPFRTCDATSLSGTSDIVLLSGILEHVPNYQEAILRACEMAQRYVILHRMLLTSAPTTCTSGTQYFVPVIRFRHNRGEIMGLLHERGFRLLYETPPYQGANRSYLFERRSPEK